MPYQHVALSPNLDTKGKREVMRLQAHKPVPLPSLEPEFVDDSAPRKPYNVDHGEQETSKVFCATPVINTFLFFFWSSLFFTPERLQHLLKKEKKAATRELRKDARFMARVQLEEELANDADRYVPEP